MGFWNRLRVGRLFFQLVKEPTRTDLIFKIVDLISNDRNQAPVRALEAFVLADPEFRAMYDADYVPTSPRMEDLAALPADSFGRHLHRHMADHGLTFDFFPRLDSRRPVDYLSTRIYQDHDLWHVLLGYGIEVEDELAVQAFGIAQFRSPIATMIIAGGLLHLLGRDPARAISAFQRLNEAYTIGVQAKFLLDVRLHEMFALPLGEVRRRCGLPNLKMDRVDLSDSVKPGAGGGEASGRPSRREFANH